MPAPSNHFTILFLYDIIPLYLKLATTAGSLQLYPEIIHNILIVPEFTKPPYLM